MSNYIGHQVVVHGEEDRKYMAPKSEDRWERDDDDASKGSSVMSPHQFEDGQGSDASRYQGSRLDANFGNGLQGGSKESRFPARSLEGLEQKFQDEIMKLNEELLDAELSRHRERIGEINTQYTEKLMVLRARQSNHGDDFLRREMQARQQSYQQLTGNKFPGGDPHGYGQLQAAYSGGQLEAPYRERAPMLQGAHGNLIVPFKDLSTSALGNALPIPFRNSRSVISESINADEEKLHVRPAFQMTVSEDSMEDDDAQNAEIGKTVSTDVNEERISDETSLVPFDSKNDGLKLDNGADTSKKAWNTAVAAQKETGIILPAPSTSTSASESLPVDQELSFKKNEVQKEGSGRSHVLCTDDEGTDKSRVSVFSSSANNVSSTSEFKFDAGLDVKPGSLISSSVAFEKQSENTGSDEKGKNEKEVELPRPAVSPIVSGSLGIYSIRDGNNGSLPSSTSAFSVPSAFPSGNGSTSVTFSSAGVAKSATTSSSGGTEFKFAPTSTLSSDIFAAAGGSELSSEEDKSKLASPFSSSFPTSTVSSSNTSVFGLSTYSAGTNSLLSGSNQSHSSLSAPSVPSTSSLFPNSESASLVKASGSQFGISSVSAPTFGLFNSSSSGPLATVLQASAPAAKFSASDTCFGMSTSLAFGSGSALSSSPVSSTSNIFGMSSTQLNSNSTGNSFNSSAPVSATASSSLFGSNSQIASSTNTVIFSSSSQSTGSGSIFGSHSQAAASNNLFGSGSQLAAGTSLLGSGSHPVSSTGLFGSSSQPASSASLFGSQPATSTSSTFGLKPGALPVFGAGFGSSTSPSSGFSFSSSGNGALTFGSTSTGVSSGSSMFFNSSTTSSGSFPAQSSVLSMSNQPVSFGSTTIQNDQMNVEDSMAEDTVQASNGIPNPFGQVANAPSPNTAPFVFGSPAVLPGAAVFQFGGHQNAPSSQPPSLFSPPGGAPTGSFSLGTGGLDKSSRRIVKVRRDKPRKK